MRLPLALQISGLLAFTTSLSAQYRTLPCRIVWDNGWSEGRCTIREQSLTPGKGPIRVTAHPNGGVKIIGWDRDEIVLRTRIDTWTGTVQQAQELMNRVAVRVSGAHISVDGPENLRGETWSASFELRVPKKSDLFVQGENGGIWVEAVEGEMDLETVNGGLTLNAVGGDVRAETINGGLLIALAGAHWNGRGLNARTTSGGIDLTIPEHYSAEFETGTVSGPLDIDFPVTIRGRLTRRFTVALGDGGPPVRVITTHGGVKVRRQRTGIQYETFIAKKLSAFAPNA